MAVMDRRQFLRRAALVASGAVAADQLELLDRLGWVRRWFAGWRAPADGWVRVEGADSGMYATQAQWDALPDEYYVRNGVVAAINAASPFPADHLRRVSPRRLLDRHGKPITERSFAVWTGGGLNV
jgi:hypothetical protein